MNVTSYGRDIVFLIFMYAVNEIQWETLPCMGIVSNSANVTKRFGYNTVCPVLWKFGVITEKRRQALCIVTFGQR